jgi:hypothetical protein
MIRTLLALSLGACLFLGGCATQRADKDVSAPAAKPAETAAPTIPPVKVPTASARRVVLTMTGPKHVVEAKDWPAFKEEWRATFQEHAKEAGIGFAFVDTSAQLPNNTDGTALKVTVNDYRMVGIGSRIFFGAMTGNAYIDARILFTSLRDGTVFGEQQQNTTSSAWHGVFAKVTPQQVDAIAADVFRDLKAARQ